MPPMNRITVERTALIERVTIIASNDASKYATQLDEYKADQARVKRAKRKQAALIERSFWKAANAIESFGTDVFNLSYRWENAEFHFPIELPRELRNELEAKIAKPKDPRPEHERALRILELSVDPTIQIAVNGDFARYL